MSLAKFPNRNQYGNSRRLVTTISPLAKEQTVITIPKFKKEQL